MCSVELLLQAGADAEAEDLAGETPLFMAARADQPPVARLLLDCGARPEHKYRFSRRPLSSNPSNTQISAAIPECTPSAAPLSASLI